MIGYLRGRIVERGEEHLILDVSGVGYDLNCSLSTLTELQGDDDDNGNGNGNVQIWVHTHVREDAISLFGFSAPLEKKMFLSLLKVNGVGPKMALKILSAASMDQLSTMIETGDVKALSNLPKVGKKTAEQLILSLKGKLVLDFEGQSNRGERSKAKAALSSVLSPRFNGVRADVLSALVNLGFRLQDAEKVVSELPENVELQQGIRDGLQALA